MLYFKMSYHMETDGCAVQNAAHLLEGVHAARSGNTKEGENTMEEKNSRAVRAAAPEEPRRRTRAWFTAKTL